MISFNIVPLDKELKGTISLNTPELSIGATASLNIPGSAGIAVNADWEATTGPAEILNKPNIPSTAADITIIDGQDRFTSTTVEDALTEISMRIENQDISKADITYVDSQFALKADKVYIHDQIAFSKDWIITHDLDKYPSVTVVDSAMSVVVGEVEYINTSQVVLHFTAEFAGKAYLN